MDVSQTCRGGPPQRFPHPLLAGCAAEPPWRPWVLALLLLACLIPRALFAWRWTTLWADSILYLDASQALDRRDFPEAFHEFGLNLYPVILCGLHRLPIAWTAAASGWSVLMACAAVLPLWGWIRRQFNDRVACVACLCYAFQGRLVANSPYVIRDATFWFLLAATLYAVWRAVVGIRLGWFLAAGLALVLAVYTRSEGWLTVVPLLGWSAGRWPSAAGARARLAAGVVLCLGMVPLSLTALNVTCLSACPQWQWLRPQHVQIVRDWWRPGTSGPAAGPDGGAPQPSSATSDRPAPANAAASALAPGDASTARLNWRFAQRMVRGYTYVGGLLLLVGIASHWRLALRRDHLALGVMNILLLALIRIRFGQAGLDIRYFMPLVLVALPWMALGFERIAAAGARRFAPAVRWTPRRYAVFLGVLGSVAAGLSMVDGRPSADRLHAAQREEALGRWILQRIGPGRTLAGSPEDLQLVRYYAQARTAEAFDLNRDEPLPAVVEAGRADAILLDPAQSGARRVAAAGERIVSQLGYRPVPSGQLPSGCESLHVFLRR
jgi:hypothetical protein